MRAIAIDGPAGAGKSTIARKTAQELGFIYVDTGALYRTIGYAVNHFGLSTKKAGEVVSALDRIHVELKFIDGEQRVFLNGEDVSDLIRSPEVSMFASEVSAIPKVREFLFDLQQDLANHHDVIMDGRDIGTVVLPNADLKIFLTATAEDRAKRRYQQFLESGTVVDFDRLLEEIKQRDYNDSHREIAPLRQAEDALLIDTTGNTLEESIDLLQKIIRNRLGLE
ncbi:(d)CMP kinase [Massiliimalia massiliensis]|uniref:(d)CMP kinase n=1 Tax=Massiliimalia massiliensis TaxID=1852384 RepID=UPI0009870B79|nr:(d)CMP kinase [Massiliimalia massiliensis]